MSGQFTHVERRKTGLASRVCCIMGMQTGNKARVYQTRTVLSRPVLVVWKNDNIEVVFNN